MGSHYISHQGVLDTYERDDDRVLITFTNRAGYYWIYPEHEENIRDLRRCMTSGETVEVTFHSQSLEISDVKVV